MAVTTPNRTRWPRITLTLPPESRDALADLARRNYREPKREAMRLLLDAIERETKAGTR
jgi:hypothetical protein